ncbi:hypothetical protein TSUD_350960 [Trifolium subterraneum]|uniref:Uncharacterized protein n=1 Tax=Trifolium subterraneum TaxID=3900 RepID=A0A2Z6P117_TRISU|nr:hypothetical protein TSUD_350960 [Trifolium subterraneum]
MILRFTNRRTQDTLKSRIQDLPPPPILSCWQPMIEHKHLPSKNFSSLFVSNPNKEGGEIF